MSGKRIVVFSGAGIDSESGIHTFRDTNDGLWYNYEIKEVATTEAWKSNKEKSSDYPSYLCYYLDYSEGRSDPIKRKLYPFEDEKLGLNHFKNLVSENIKKGWEKHGA